MSFQKINRGSSIQAFDGDDRLTVIDKINAMFTELYGGTGPDNFFFINPAPDPHNADVGFRGASLRFQGYDGSEQFRVETVPSAVSFMTARGGIANSMPVLVCEGSPTDIPFSFAAKGGGNLLFGNGWGTLFAIDDSGGSVRNDNYIKVLGNVSGSSPQVTADGTDTNLDVILNPKGTGNIRFGTFTATPATSAGYITVKDAGGTVRKLMVGT